TAFFDFLGGFTNSILGGSEDNLKRIVVQHWISLFGQNIDAWVLLRRTQVIPFKPNFNANQNDGYVNGTWAYIPERLTYPLREININSTETQNAIQNYLYDNKLKDRQDRVTFRLIFAADNPGLPAPPMGTPAYTAFPYPLPNQAMNR
ncbi:MAG TPA: SusD/RagB family nutrient-binding outer membrane lipoprotein, partial [Prolixibacteraceae bacterium]|nr:SusD/RagB family nutrient-binding outer membrane lipoprotein [Prolixibacteraceae bacterium]